MPTISTQPITTPQISSPVPQDGNKETSIPSHLQAPQVGREIRAYQGLHDFFGAGKTILGQTHSQRLMSAAKEKDRSKLMHMIEPGAESNGDSLRKLSTGAGTVIGVKYEGATAVIPPEAERNSKFIAPLMERYEKGNLDVEGKHQLMQGLAYRAYTSPVLHTAEGRDITFSQLATTSTWQGITQKDLSDSDIDQRLAATISDLGKAYEIAASFPQNKPATSKPQYAMKAKGLQKLLQERKKGNLLPEAKRQMEKFNHKAASFFKAKPYVDSNLGEVFSVELRLLKTFVKTRDREEIEKKIIENQVLATIKQRTSPSGFFNTSPGGIARDVKKKSNYQHLSYPDKDIYLAEFIEKVMPVPEEVQQPASKAAEDRPASKEGDDRSISKAGEDRPTSKAGEKPLEDFSSGTSSQEVTNSRALSAEDALADKDLGLQDAMDGLWRWYEQNPQSSRS